MLAESQIRSLAAGEIVHVATEGGCHVVTVEFIQPDDKKRRYSTAWGRSGTVVQGISLHTAGAHLPGQGCGSAFAGWE